MDETIRAVLAEHAVLAKDPSSISDRDDLYRLGLTSHSSVNVMLALEESFDTEFADDMLRRETFASIASIRAALRELGCVDAA